MVRLMAGKQVNVDKTNYIIMFRGQNAGRSHTIKTDIFPIERGRFQISRTTLTNQNSILKEIMSRFKLGNTCYYSAHYVFFSICYPKIYLSRYIEL
jgi:hypothetical protein